MGNICKHCDKKSIIDGNEEYDACIGSVQGACNACCGHGDVARAYIQFFDESHIKGQDALDIMKIMSKTPNDALSGKELIEKMEYHVWYLKETLQDNKLND